MVMLVCHVFIAASFMATGQPMQSTGPPQMDARVGISMKIIGITRRLNDHEMATHCHQIIL